MFIHLGYSRSSTTRNKTGYCKVALYENADGPSHAARQETGTSRWLSKLGQGHDIAHYTAEDLEGTAYGRVIRAFERPLIATPVVEIPLRYATGGKVEIVTLDI